jgi:hypothetical protein
MEKTSADIVGKINSGVFTLAQARDAVAHVSAVLSAESTVYQVTGGDTNEPDGISIAESKIPVP